MVQIKTVLKTCFVCHKSSKQLHSAPTPRPGPAGTQGIVDLEGRPEELTADILRQQLEVCPYCGYIAEDLGEKTVVTSGFLHSLDYCSLQNPEIPPSPSRYMRAALIQLEENNPEKAIDYYLSAAWSADSLYHRETAVSCRRKALALIFGGNKTFADIPPDKWVPVLDTMRRCGDFDLVIAHCTGLSAGAEQVLKQELDEELRYAKQHDSEPHTRPDPANRSRYRPGSPETGREFIIGGKSYSREDDCHGRGWTWDAETCTLVLSNYHGSPIEASGDITIRVDQLDNQITSAHGPGIYIRDGNLKFIGAAILSISGEARGIFVESGTLDIAATNLIIRTHEEGILTSGAISATNGSVIDVSSETTAIKSESGGLNTTNSSLKIYGKSVGMDLAADASISSGAQYFESSGGCGILVRHGSLTVSGCVFNAVCKDAGLRLEDGNLSFNAVVGDLNGASCALVLGSASIFAGAVNFSGEEYGVSVSGDMEISGKTEFLGKTAIAVGGTLLIQNGNSTVSGETGITVGGDLKYGGGNLMITGDTALHVSGDVEISAGQIMGVGRIDGIVVDGSYSQSGGAVTISGDAEDGMRISGKKMVVNGGLITASGRKNGLGVMGSVVLDGCVLSASGNVGFFVGKSLKIEQSSINVAGEAIGISVREGNLITGNVVAMTVTGNVGIYTTKDIGIHGAFIQITGRFAGIVTEKGNLVLSSGILEITAEEYGVLLQSGSMKSITGIIRITNSRMTDSGGCGIVVEKGSLQMGGLVTINAESYGISMPGRDISLEICKMEAYGFRAGITGKSLTLKYASLTAYGKTEEAVVLTGHGPWNDVGVVVLAGKSGKSATSQVYSGHRFVHAYTEHVPDDRDMAGDF